MGDVNYELAHSARGRATKIYRLKVQRQADPVSLVSLMKDKDGLGPIPAIPS